MYDRMRNTRGESVASAAACLSRELLIHEVLRFGEQLDVTRSMTLAGRTAA
jgi:hypothetical protein